MQCAFDVITAFVLGVLAFNTPTWANDDEEFYDALEEQQPDAPASQPVGVWDAMKNAAKTVTGRSEPSPDKLAQHPEWHDPVNRPGLPGKRAYVAQEVKRKAQETFQGIGTQVTRGVMNEFAQPHHQALIAETAAHAAAAGATAGIASAQAALTPSFPKRAWNKTKEVVSRGTEAVKKGARAVVSGSKQVYRKAKSFVTRRTPPPVPGHS